jgi:23S rRNA U2552 (ribose-2'-O)-methylase RlmE/FtsJ
MVDPLINLCWISKDDIIEQRYQEITLPQPYRNQYNTVKIIDNIQYYNPNREDPPIVDLETNQKLDEINKISDIISTNQVEFDKYRSIINPFESMHNPFINRAALKLANLDAHYKFTKGIGGSLGPQTLGPFHYCDIAGAPGSWTEYVQYRRPHSIGYGISLANPKNTYLTWDVRLDYNRFTTFYGSDGSGDLYRMSLEFSEYVIKSTGEGVDLAMADGGFDVNNRRRKESLSVRLILSELLTGILCTKIGGDMVCKLFDTVTKPTVDLIYLTSLTFDTIHIMKPLTSRPTNNERYLIAKGRRNNKMVVDIMTNIWRTNRFPSSIISELPKDFIEWITNINKEIVDYNYYYINMLKDYVHGNQIWLPYYDVERCITYFDISSKPMPQRIHKNPYEVNRSYYEMTTVINRNTNDVSLWM